MRLSPSDIKALIVFRAIVEHGGFLGAQVAIGTSQSALSFHMKALEERIGYRLCRRGRGGFDLTDRGAIVYERSKALFAAISAFESEVGELGARVSGTLRLGLADNTITDPRLPIRDVLHDFLRKSDRAQLKITIGEPEQIITEVGNGGIEIGLVPETQRYKGLNFTRFHEEVHSLYCGRRHPLFAEEPSRITVEAVRSHPFVIRPYAGSRELRHYRGAPVGAHASNMEAQAMFVLSGHFLGYLPDHYAGQWVESGELRPLLARKTRIRSPFFIVTRVMDRRPLLMRAFLSDLVFHCSRSVVGKGKRAAAG
jgi:LysR family transcriptional regulator, transcriptional activator for bauABCD operon